MTKLDESTDRAKENNIYLYTYTSVMLTLRNLPHLNSGATSLSEPSEHCNSLQSHTVTLYLYPSRSFKSKSSILYPSRTNNDKNILDNMSFIQYLLLSVL